MKASAASVMSVRFTSVFIIVFFICAVLVKRAGAALAEYTVVLRVYRRLRGTPFRIDGDARKVMRGEQDVEDDATGDDHFGKRAPAAPREQALPAMESVERDQGQ